MAEARSPARHYVYAWADGVYLQACMEEHSDCMLVLTNRNFRGNVQPAAFQVDEQLAPALGAFSNADLEADEFFLALGRRAEIMPFFFKSLATVLLSSTRSARAFNTAPFILLASTA